MQKLTLDDGKLAMVDHAKERGHLLYQKYGPSITDDVLFQILKDEDFIRFPVTIEYSREKVGGGTFAVTEQRSEKADEGYVIYIHDYFQGKEGCLAPLVFYQLVQVNYGDFATYEVAEAFGSEALGMNQEDYYQYLCRMADAIQ